LRGNDEVEVTRNLKQAKPNELDSHFRGNDGMQVRGNDVVQVRGNDVVQVSVWMDSSFPRRRESRTWNLKKPFYPISFRTDRPRFPLSWE
ncbi:hypothetical protein, partial [Neisseria meningitidis]|uniref:hypothetical protein n=1 Tax=Neisseria meningitidis TaxID=487 RepID=UPI001E301D37